MTLLSDRVGIAIPFRNQNVVDHRLGNLKQPRDSRLGDLRLSLGVAQNVIDF